MDGWDGATSNDDGLPLGLGGHDNLGRPGSSAPLGDLLASQGSLVTFRGGDSLCRPSVAPENVYFIRTGWAYSYHKLEEGSRQILRFLLPGDMTPAVTLGADPRVDFGVCARSPILPPSRYP